MPRPPRASRRSRGTCRCRRAGAPSSSCRRRRARLSLQPPPTATTISRRSPSPIRVSACALFGTISPFRSTAIFLPESSSLESSAPIPSGASKEWALPFTVTWITGSMILEALALSAFQALQVGNVAILAFDGDAPARQGARAPPQPGPDTHADREGNAESDRGEHQRRQEKQDGHDGAEESLDENHASMIWAGRVEFNGRTAASQAAYEGSIPFTRSTTHGTKVQFPARPLFFTLPGRELPRARLLALDRRASGSRAAGSRSLLPGHRLARGTRPGLRDVPRTERTGHEQRILPANRGQAGGVPL